MRIYILHLGGMGDLIVCLPGIKALVEAHPDWDVTLIADGPYLGLAAMWLDRITLASATTWPWQALWDRWIENSPSPLPPCDVVVDLWGRGQRRGHIEWVTGGQYLAVMPDPGDPKQGIMAERVCAEIGQLFGFQPHYEDIVWAVPSPPWSPDKIGLPGRLDESPFVVMFPGAGVPTRCWPEQQWWSLAHRFMVEDGLKTVCVTGPKEADRGLAPPPGLFDFQAHAPTLPGLASVMARAALVVTNDTGPSHIAAWAVSPAGVRVPTVILMRSCIVEQWGTRRPWVHLVQLPEARPGDLSVGEVWERSQAALRAASSRVF
jgi:ADP-heptose:LPS heptosyltransferase